MILSSRIYTLVANVAMSYDHQSESPRARSTTSSEQPVTLRRWDEAPLVFLDHAGARTIELLRDALSYRPDGYQYSTAFQRNNWDGSVKLLTHANRGGWYFPLGCLDQVTQLLDSNDIHHTVKNVSPPGPGDCEFSWQTDMTLRDYQQDAVESALSHSRGIVALPTGAGKTLVGLRIIHQLARPTLVVVHRKAIAEQWVARIENILDVDVARYFDSDRDTTGPVQVALYQSLWDDDAETVRIDGDAELLVCDEAHTVGAQMFHNVTRHLNSSYRIGLTATPERDDNATLRVVGGTGPVIADITPESLISRNYLAEPYWLFIEPPTDSHAPRSYSSWRAEYNSEIVHSRSRNEQVARAVSRLPRPIYIHVERIAHGNRLQERLSQSTADDCAVRFVHGSTSNRRQLLQSFQSGQLPVLISTLAGEGFDAPCIQSLIMAGGLKTETGTIQTVGRALRPATDRAYIVDFLDSGDWIGDHTQQRIETYCDYYGEYGPNTDATDRPSAVTLPDSDRAQPPQ